MIMENELTLRDKLAMSLEFNSLPEIKNQLVDEYTETVVKNCTISVAEEQSKQATKRCFCGAEFDGIQCNSCGFDASEVDIY